MTEVMITPETRHHNTVRIVHYILSTSIHLLLSRACTVLTIEETWKVYMELSNCIHFSVCSYTVGRGVKGESPSHPYFRFTAITCGIQGLLYTLNICSLRTGFAFRVRGLRNLD